MMRRLAPLAAVALASACGVDIKLPDGAQKIDGVKLTKKNLKISAAERKTAVKNTPPKLKAALKLAAWMAMKNGF